MTGEEYWNLKRGETITVETSSNDYTKCNYTKGKVFKVEYIDFQNQYIYIRDVTAPLGEQIGVITLAFLLNYFIKGGKLPEKRDTKKDDKVNHPSHYTWLKELCGIEVIDITRHLDFNLGNSIKYILRSGHKKEEGYTNKQKTIEDLKKAVWYLNDEIKLLSDEQNKEKK